jgi:hypothetical protein
MPVGKPALGLLGKPIDQDKGIGTPIAPESQGHIEEMAPVRLHRIGRLSDAQGEIRPGKGRASWAIEGEFPNIPRLNSQD